MDMLNALRHWGRTKCGRLNVPTLNLITIFWLDQDFVSLLKHFVFLTRRIFPTDSFARALCSLQTQTKRLWRVPPHVGTSELGHKIRPWTSIFVFICLFIYLFIYLIVCLFVCLFFLTTVYFSVLKHSFLCLFGKKLFMHFVGTDISPCASFTLCFLGDYFSLCILYSMLSWKWSSLVHSPFYAFLERNLPFLFISYSLSFLGSGLCLYIHNILHFHSCQWTLH